MSESKLIAGTIVIAVFCAWAYILIVGEPGSPIGIANGTYSNPCCGTLILKDDIMSVASQRISYVIESNKNGPYVLAKAYVVASGVCS